MITACVLRVDSLPADERVKEPEVGTLKPAPVFDFGIVGTVQSSVLSAAAEEPAAMPVKLKSELSPSDAQHTIDACKVPPRQRTGFVGPPVESQLWTEKYKPTQSAHLVGNYNSVSKFGKWVAQSWKPGMPPPKVRSVLLSGPPGIGKTSACHVILKEVGFDVVEFNASDVRSKTSVQAQIESMTQNRSMGEFFQAANLSTKRVALIMDEVDGMSSGDRGGMQELIKIIQMTQIPIVCCCNDDGHQKVRALKKYCLCLPFQRPQPEMVLNRIMDVAKKEGMDLGLEACRQLFEGCNGDLRQMITNLQMWKNDKGDLNGLYLSTCSSCVLGFCDDLCGCRYDDGTSEVSTQRSLTGVYFRKCGAYNGKRNLGIAHIPCKLILGMVSTMHHVVHLLSRRAPDLR
eukprot:SAG31_NODE_2043_length_6582_cov_2.798952_6_plen_402_part_00